MVLGHLRLAYPQVIRYLHHMSIELWKKKFSKPLDSEENRAEHESLFGRCKKCNLQNRVCICDREPRIDTKIPLHLVIHFKETKRPSNSGLLAARCIKPSYVYKRGDPSLKSADVDFKLGETQPLLLFPAPGAVLLSQEYAQSFSKPVSLIVPDGNWNQASRMPKRIASLKDVPRVVLPLGEEPEFRLRREDAKPEGLSTLDAIARAYKLLGEDHVHDELLKIFRIMAIRTLWSKGCYPTEKAEPFL